MAGFLAMLPTLVPALTEVLDRVIPDQAAAAKAKLEMEAKLLEAATAQASQQAEINKLEAQHSSIFVAGWRPYIGWVCGMAIAWAFLVAPMLSWLLPVLGVGQWCPRFRRSSCWNWCLRCWVWAACVPSRS